MDQNPAPKSHAADGQYDVAYGNFQTELYQQIRREAFGEDIGQNSWLTVEEQDGFLGWLNLSPGKILLDVACGTGGPGLRTAAITGCCLVGIDAHERAVSTGRLLATQRGLSTFAEFRVADAAERLPFPNDSFDAITCIDAINHLSDRRLVISEWARLLKPGGTLLFTDPTTVTGPLTNTEIAVRSSTGFYLFVPPEYDERVVAQCGLHLFQVQDVTRNMAEVAQRRRAARASRSVALREMEGDLGYDGQQDFLEVSARIAKEGRLSRILYAARK